MLSSVPSAVVIAPPIEVSFGAAGYRVSEGATLQVPVVLNRAHHGSDGTGVVVTASGVSASTDDFLVGGV